MRDDPHVGPFDRTPFADALFNALARDRGCHDDGRGWSLRPDQWNGSRRLDWEGADCVGIASDRIEGMPDGMPTFRYGHDDGGTFLSILLENVVYRRRDRERSIALTGPVLPDTVMTALAGRPAETVLAHRALAGLTIASVFREKAGENLHWVIILAGD